MRAILLFCLTLSFYFLSAQSMISSKQIGWSGNQIMLQTIHDKSGSLYASLLENPESFIVTLYDRAFKEVHEYNISRINQEELVAGFIKDGKIYFFCNYKSPSGFDNYTIDISSGEINHVLVLSDKRKEKLIDRISSGDYALWLGIDKKNSSFVIYNWRNQQDLDTMVYTFKDQVMWESITKLQDSMGTAITLGSNREEGQMSMPGYGIYSGSSGKIIGEGGMGGFSSGTWTRAVRFRMLVDSSSFQHVTGDMEPSINDRIDQFSEDIKIPEPAENLLFRDGRYIYMYYDKKKQSLVLQQFPI